MALIPVVSDVEKWVKHFTEMAQQKHRPRKFFVLGDHSGEGSSVKLVTPVAETVVRARGELQRRKKLIKGSQPPVKKRKRNSRKPAKKAERYRDLWFTS